MASKQLFSVSLAEDKKNEYFDGTPFTEGRVSPTTREARERGTKQLTKIMVKSMKLPQMIVGYILIGLGLIVLFSFIKALPDVDFMTALNNGKWLLLGGGASAAAGIALLIYCRIASKKQEASEDVPAEMDESLSTLEGVSRRIITELGLPEDDEELTGIEILPYRYKPTSDGDTKEILSSGCYENTEVFFWREGDYLCVTDYDSVMRFPLSAVAGYCTADVKYKISYWFKDEEFNKGEYARYGIKQDSEGNYKLRTYYRVVIRDGEDDYEIRVPAYDFDKFQEIVGAACLDGVI